MNNPNLPTTDFATLHPFIHSILAKNKWSYEDILHRIWHQPKFKTITKGQIAQAIVLADKYKEFFIPFVKKNTTGPSYVNYILDVIYVDPKDWNGNKERNAVTLKLAILMGKDVLNKQPSLN